MQISALCSGLLLTCVWSQAADADDFSPQERAIIKTLSPLPDLPVDTTNEYRNSRAAALLGQKLFFEPRLSGPIQTGTPADGQLGAIGEKYKIACRKLPYARIEMAVRHSLE
jgi:cytochrome c peroxidase